MQPWQPALGLFLPQVLHDVFDHHDSGVHQHAQRDGQSPQTHQVGGHACSAHHDERAQRRERQNNSDRHGRSQIAEESAQQQQHDHRGFDQRTRHGADRLLHQVGPVVEDIDRHAWRQGGLELRELAGHTVDDLLRIGTCQSQHQPFDRLVLAVFGHHAVARHAAVAHQSDVAESSDVAILVAHDNRAQIVCGLDIALTAYQQHLAAFAETTCAIVAIVRFDRTFDLSRRQAQCRQLHGVGDNLKTAHLAAERVHVGDARHGPKRRANHPVEQASLVFERQGWGLDGEHEHLAERRGDRRHATADAGGKIGRDVGQALGHLLASPVDVGAVLEVDGHIDQTVFRHGSQHALLRDAQHFDFDRSGDAALDFFRRHARRLHDDLHLGAGNIGKGIDRQVAKGIPAKAGQQSGPEQHEQTLRQCKLNQAVEHLSCFRSCRARRPSGQSPNSWPPAGPRGNRR